jgi:hypothetical protein
MAISPDNLRNPLETERPQDVAPWEREAEEQRQNLSEQYAEKNAFKESTKSGIDSQIEDSVQRQNAEIALDWFNSKKAELRGKGIPVDVSDDQKINIAIQEGAFEELKKFRDMSADEVAGLSGQEKSRYRKYKETQELNLLKTDLQKDAVPIGSYVLSFNFLNKKYKALNSEIENLQAQPNPPAEIIQPKVEELNKLFTLRLDAAEKIYGKNFAKEVSEGIEADTDAVLRRRLAPAGISADKDDYIRANLGAMTNTEIKKSVFDKDWTAIPEADRTAKYGGNMDLFVAEKIADIQTKITKGARRFFRERAGGDLSEIQILTLLSKSVNPTEFQAKRGWRFWMGKRGRLLQFKADGETMSPRDFHTKMTQFTTEVETVAQGKAKGKLNDFWEAEAKKAKDGEFDQVIQERLDGLERLSPSKIKEMFGQLKDRLVAEWQTGELKKDPKTREQIQKIQEKWGGKTAVDTAKFVADVFQGKGLERLGEGTLLQDVGLCYDFFQSCGIDLPRAEIKNYLKASQDKYKKTKKKGKGFMNFIFGFFEKKREPVAPDKKKSKTKSAGSIPSGGTGMPPGGFDPFGGFGP